MASKRDVFAVLITSKSFWDYESKSYDSEKGFYNDVWLTDDKEKRPCMIYYQRGDTDETGFTPESIQMNDANGVVLIMGKNKKGQQIRRAFKIGEPAPQYLTIKKSKNSRRPTTFIVTDIITDTIEGVPNIKKYLGVVDEEEEELSQDEDFFNMKGLDYDAEGFEAERKYGDEEFGLINLDNDHYLRMDNRNQITFLDFLRNLKREYGLNLGGFMFVDAIGNQYEIIDREYYAEDFEAESHTDRIARLRREMEQAQDELERIEYCNHQEWNSINGWVDENPFSLTIECPQCGSHGVAEWDEPTAISWDKTYLAEEFEAEEDEKAERIMKLLRIVKRKATGSNARYAKTYADAAEIAYYDYGFKGLKTQVAYVLSNLSGWRGDEAREVKAELRRLVK
jgi:hypothetical protein